MEQSKVLITGANRGIGLALATQYANAGAQVFAVCRSRSEGLDHDNITVVDGVDVTSADAVTKISEVLYGQHLDILINNAGILSRETLHDAPEESILKQFAVNSLAPLRLTIGLLPNLKEGSKVALITSRLGSMTDNGSGGYYGYRMSKAALNAAGVSLAKDLETQGISVALLHPGYVQTDMVNNSGDISADTAAERLRQRIEELNQSNSGTFWHSNGEVLPW
ncbi:SDR family oxidoreductase [Aliidiomarina indica]|uniref:SDR family oxidoreductase n=1 Tax=Aliidiomarina indica TaxID=2749147 RepID=UPI00188EFEF0|nr:SDR family oxidoreductase [Aliidiomarina indica]